MAKRINTNGIAILNINTSTGIDFVSWIADVVEDVKVDKIFVVVVMSIVVRKGIEVVDITSNKHSLSVESYSISNPIKVGL